MMALGVGQLWAQNQARDEIHVSVTTGDDANSGTPEKPLKSLQAARDKAREMKSGNDAKKITVYLHQGHYNLDRTLDLGPEDSHVSYRAVDGASPVVSGVRLIKNWKPFTEDLPGVHADAKGKLWVADVPKGWRFHYLFVNGRRAERSKSSHAFWREWPKDHQPGKPEKQGQLVSFNNKEQLRFLPSNGDVEMVCIMAQYGVMGNGVVTDVNSGAGTLRWNSKLLNLAGSRNNHERGYRFENALCLIDRPGEWALDSALGRVYYWPKDGEDMSKAKSHAPSLYKLVHLQGDETKNAHVTNVTFEGITFAYTDRVPENQWPDHWLCRQWENVDAALYFSGTSDCVVRNCRILHTGAYGITINHYGQRNRIERCEIGWTGSGGVFLEGYGPGTLDVSKNNTVTGNYIHDHGLGNYWHAPSVQIYQSGHNTISYNLLQRSAYSSISMVGMHPKYMNMPSRFFKGVYQGQWHEWNFFCLRSEDFPKEVQDAIRAKKPYFNRENMKPYLHSRKNVVEYNVISEPQTKLNEGGAIYAWCIGKDNLWRKNVIFKSRAMPGSSVLALDDIAEYTTVKDNVVWVNGRILEVVGARSSERGNVISGNVRVNFKKEHQARRGHNNLGKWQVNVDGREPMDTLLGEITSEVGKRGGWPGNPAIGIPKPGEEITKYGEQLILPKGANVTIEE